VLAKRVTVLREGSVLLAFGMPDDFGSITMDNEFCHGLEKLLNDLFILAHWRCVAVLPDGHCLFRCAGKHLQMHPGAVRQMVDQFWQKEEGRAAAAAEAIKGNEKLCTSASEWRGDAFRVERTAACRSWGHVKEDEYDECNALDWGGSAEIKLLAIANDMNIVVFDCSDRLGSWDTSRQGIVIYTPSPSSAGGDIYPNQAAEGPLKCLHRHHSEKTLYLLYSGVHFNPILFASDTMGDLCSGAWNENQVTGESKCEKPQQKKKRRRGRGGGDQG
jgi:hypothetical protein